MFLQVKYFEKSNKAVVSKFEFVQKSRKDLGNFKKGRRYFSKNRTYGVRNIQNKVTYLTTILIHVASSVMKGAML